MALQQFGFGALGVEKADLTTPERVIQLGYPPRRIDLFTSIDGVEFDDCFTRKFVVELDGLHLHFIGLDDFKQNKRAVGRHQDLADLESLGEPDGTDD